MISIKGYEQGIPTIVINAPWCGDNFNAFVQSIEQPVIVVFDEFEKVYNSEEQEQMLTLLDGVYSGRKLFILTCNDKWRIDSHMRNRPGRIFYYFDFKGLEEGFIREYCNDNLINKKHIDTIVNISGVFGAFNFDMLKALVEDMNRYDETPQESLRVLNVRAEFDSGSNYEVKIYRGEEEANRISPAVWNGTPLANGDLEFGFHIVDPSDNGRRVRKSNAISGAIASAATPLDKVFEQEIEIDDEPIQQEKEYGWMEVELKPADLVKLDTKSGRFIFEKGGVTVILNRIRERSFNFDAF